MTLDWSDVASTFGIKRCAGCIGGDHLHGWARRGVVHWSDRRMTKAGLRRFLMLIASQVLLDFPALPKWDRIYRANVWATNAVRRFHVRFPFQLSEADRARVRWLIRNEQDIPDRVKRWANRSAT